jgi:hypothetical protein
MRRTPALIGAAALVVLVALFLILQGGDDDETTTSVVTTTTPATTAETTTQDTTRETTKETTTRPEPEVATIVIRNGEPVGGVQELSFTEGDDIRFVVESDVADHVHLHGYDVFEDVEPGRTAEFNVPATIPGVFEVELEDRVVPIAEITVNPS